MEDIATIKSTSAIKEIKTLLENYQVSEEAKSILKTTPFVAIIGPSSVGRDTIIRELVKKGTYYVVISDTTRAPRENDGIMERDGIDYYFRTEEAMLNDLKNGMFVEASVNHRMYAYGVSVREVAKANKLNKVAITDLTYTDLNSSNKLKDAKSDAILIFVMPPNFEAWLRRIKRRTPGMPKDELRQRLMSARNEFTIALNNKDYKYVVNDNLDESVDMVDGIVNNHANNSKGLDRTMAHNILNKLIADLDKYMS